MTKSTIFIILFSIIMTACHEQQSETKSTSETVESKIMDDNFQKTINSIKASDIYENRENWNARGLNPSEQSVILILRKATNDFLDKLEKIYISNESSETKLEQISNIVNELPWGKLDTEEKEFMADTIAPAIVAAGYDPWTVF